MTDQNSTTHTYSHDVLGRLTADAVTTLGTGVNGSVRLHTYSFTPLGEPYLSTSYSGTTPTPTPTNQAEDVYNGLGQLTQEYQAHSGAVITTPTPTATASVTYAYAGLGSSSQDYSRLSSVTYPDGEVIDYGYNNSTLDNAISRVDFLSQGGSHILDYTYLGLATVASAAYGDGVTLSYFTSGSSSSDSGDEYTGLDRFDRIIEQKYATTTPTPTTTDDFTYAFDADSDLLYQDNMLKSTQSLLYHPNSTASGDDSTAYDALGRETAYRQGTLSASGNNGAVLDTVTTAVNSATYSLDALGNQATVNSQNELTGSLLAYNNDGDQTESPAAGGGGYCTCDTYDAWNEMVSFTNGSSGGTTCETMGYDALGREISDTYSPASGVSGSDGKYYSADAQVVQDNCSCSCGCGCSFSSATTTDNFVWAPDYVNDLVLRDRTVSATTTRLYAQHDANFDVTALVNTSGTVTERLAYDPYGNVTVLTAAWGSTTDSSWQIRFQGMWLDNTTGLYKTLNRDYSPTEARWIEADPAGYVDGSSLYQAFDSDPVVRFDPLGQSADPKGDDGADDSGPGAQELMDKAKALMQQANEQVSSGNYVGARQTYEQLREVQAKINRILNNIAGNNLTLCPTLSVGPHGPVVPPIPRVPPVPPIPPPASPGPLAYVAALPVATTLAGALAAQKAAAEAAALAAAAKAQAQSALDSLDKLGRDIYNSFPTIDYTLPSLPPFGGPVRSPFRR